MRMGGGIFLSFFFSRWPTERERNVTRLFLSLRNVGLYRGPLIAKRLKLARGHEPRILGQ